MNSAKQLVLTTFLAFAILSSISIGNIGNVFATGGLDDEEEEEAIKELQNNVEDIQGDVSDIKEDIDGLTLNLEEGQNALTAICPSEPEPEPEPPVQNETEAEGCNPVEPEPEPEPPQTVLPPVQNETEGCNPIPEPEPEPEQSVLEPIICPINGELLGYTNTTSGEQLPISAGNQSGQESNNTGFLPPIEIIEEEEQEQQVAPEINQTETNGCNNVTAPEEPAELPPVEQNVSQPVEDIGFDLDCACFVSQNGSDTPPVLEGGIN